ncbi:hypothetical protein DL96DRAFT_1585776 [Flagelloscypha sp. PMI_526]|nr:hypothetical protein DL96DRAFT_1585776 [Flagelloscypha sp. PMI_526]
MKSEPVFPEDLERLIFKTTALSSKKSVIASLTLVARRVNTWITPILLSEFYLDINEGDLESFFSTPSEVVKSLILIPKPTYRRLGVSTQSLLALAKGFPKLSRLAMPYFPDGRDWAEGWTKDVSFSVMLAEECHSLWSFSSWRDDSFIRTVPFLTHLSFRSLTHMFIPGHLGELGGLFLGELASKGVLSKVFPVLSHLAVDITYLPLQGGRLCEDGEALHRVRTLRCIVFVLNDEDIWNRDEQTHPYMKERHSRNNMLVLVELSEAERERAKSRGHFDFLDEFWDRAEKELKRRVEDASMRV